MDRRLERIEALIEGLERRLWMTVYGVVAVILTQVPHQGSEVEEARAGFAAKGITLFDTRLHFRKDYYKATPIGRTAVELEPNGKASAELRAAYSEAKRLSDYTVKQVNEVA